MGAHESARLLRAPEGRNSRVKHVSKGARCEVRDGARCTDEACQYRKRVTPLEERLRGPR